MNRLVRAANLGLAAIVLALAASCQVQSAAAPSATRIYRIGYLAGGSPPRSPFQESFVQALAELGYVEGQNLNLEFRYAEGQDDRLPALAADLVAAAADVIVGASTPAVLAAKQATRTTPIVMAAVADPVASGLVVSLARPGTNVTGPTLQANDLAGKRLELLRDVVPGVARVAMLWNPSNPAKRRDLEETQAAAQTLGIELVSVETRTASDVRAAGEALADEAVDGLVVAGDPLTVGLRAEIAEIAARGHIPAVYETPDFVEAGGLMGYGPNRFDVYRRAAVYVDKILKGANPENLPVEHPTRYELVVNIPAAEGLGLTLPQSLLVSADRIVR